MKFPKRFIAVYLLLPGKSVEFPEPFEDRIAEISLDLAEEDDIEEDDFEEDTFSGR